MSATVFLAVLLAALLHAGWNSAIKLKLDRASAVLLLSIFQAVIALPILPFVALPATEAWPWIVLSAALHCGYKIFLVQAYEHADLSQAYPLARGAAPLIVTLVSVAFLGTQFTTPQIAAVLLISGGVLVMAFKGAGGRRMSHLGLFFAGGTAVFTASYTLADGVGARIAETASGYILWMVLGDTILMCLWAWMRRGKAAFTGFSGVWLTGFAAGAMSLGSYWIAVWAFTQAPIALVAALRETSILFSMLIAAIVLRESLGRWRWIAALLIAAGTAAARL